MVWDQYNIWPTISKSFKKWQYRQSPIYRNILQRAKILCIFGDIASFSHPYLAIFSLIFLFVTAKMVRYFQISIWCVINTCILGHFGPVPSIQYITIFSKAISICSIAEMLSNTTPYTYHKGVYTPCCHSRHADVTITVK